ncbi:C40 family peptidase [Saxibacter everestensis]|uniref:C40 family peptidase n=1 Tax=Saxibacter everestensis TaxID=2909229 RepID=A0ABY8QWM4_9MICO|nr:C40 family peptidase [Brevibacteriaceae bacterium ZFBP1038]
MSNSHRAEGPATTPLSILSGAVAASSSTVVRRGAVVAATSGLVVAMGLPAQAITDHAEAAAGEASASESAPVNNAALTVDSAQVRFSQETFAAKPAPKPEPEPERDTAPASRDSERKAPAAESTSDENAKPQGKNAASVVSIAKRYLGVPYVWGGSSPSGFDCSGFTGYVYKQVGVDLPRTSSAQRGAGKIVSQSEAKAGDLVWHSGHIGIYLGDGKKIHSPQTGDVVKISDLSSSDTTFIRVL